MALAPDTILQNRYQIVRQLGQGGMGTVYEARALRLNTIVALKETHFTDDRLRKQFEREAQLLAGLRHPALPRVIDHFDEGDGLYLVMDFIEGDDLWGMLQQRGSAFSANEVIAWAEQLLDALQYLHAQNPPVIHRDVKLQNLKLSDKGQIILLDFGLAKGLANATVNVITTRTVLGFSLAYSPLEQILQTDENSRELLSVTHPEEVERLRKSGTDHRSDLYSVGATLLHLLTNRIPTNAPTRAISVWSGRIDPLEKALRQEGIPDKLSAVLKQSMALEPNERFSSAIEMRRALENIGQTEQSETIALPPTLVGPPTQIRESIPQPVRKPSRLALMLVGIGALIVIGSIIVTVINRSGSNTKVSTNTNPATTNLSPANVSIASIPASNSNQASNVAATPIPSPSPTSVISLEDTTWEGFLDGEYQRKYEFKTGGEVIEKAGGKVGNNSPMSTYIGSWTLRGNRVSMKFPRVEGSTGKEIEATIQGDEMTGELTWAGNSSSNKLLLRKTR